MGMEQSLLATVLCPWEQKRCGLRIREKLSPYVMGLKWIEGDVIPLWDAPRSLAPRALLLRDVGKLFGVWPTQQLAVVSRWTFIISRNEFTARGWRQAWSAGKPNQEFGSGHATANASYGCVAMPLSLLEHKKMGGAFRAYQCRYWSEVSELSHVPYPTNKAL